MLNYLFKLSAYCTNLICHTLHLLSSSCSYYLLLKDEKQLQPSWGLCALHPSLIIIFKSFQQLTLHFLVFEAILFLFPHFPGTFSIFCHATFQSLYHSSSILTKCTAKLHTWLATYIAASASFLSKVYSLVYSFFHAVAIDLL